ncbi:hypothetical protein [Rhodopseudomonas telluris]|uniref:Uncharacterized protein n=1 Tax=Rhodopseudomonas telluris TaxID=644215 RepID=A0ABV6EZM6_9BRAD
MSDILMGVRYNGDCGLFVAPPGINAYYASNEQLRLNISDKVSQLVLFGWVGGSAAIGLGFSRSPFVIITSREPMYDIVAISGLEGAIRPSPSGLKRGTNQDGGVTFRPTTKATATIVDNGAWMAIEADRPTSYAVYNAPFT